MPSKEKVVIASRYTGKEETEELEFELIRSAKLKKGQISVIVHDDLSISIVASKKLSMAEIYEIILVQYNNIKSEIMRVKRKHIR